jgi:uroporphyrinogen decarboxylase
VKPRDRVLAAINHEQPDHVPLILGVDHSTGISLHAYRRLKTYLGVEADEGYLYGSWRELGGAQIDEAVLRRLGSDARGVWDRKPRAVEERNERRGPGEPYVDEYGVGQIETAPEEWFPGLHPLAELSLAALEAHPWPDMNDATQYAGVRERAAALAREGEYAVFGAPWLLFPFERAMQIHGMEAFMTALAVEPDLAQALLARLTQLFKLHLARFLDEMDGNADVIMLGDDLGMQEGLLISPEMYRAMLKPCHAELIEAVKSRSRAKVWFHSDGDIFPVLDDLIEIGVDILNPVQTSAGQMSDLLTLKRRYGKRLCFCGAIDTQRVLPYGTPGEVRQEVRRVIEILGPGGGYMVASVHSIMNDVPPENILAMADAVRAADGVWHMVDGG